MPDKAQAQPPARIVVEMSPAVDANGRRILVLEYYINGARTRHAIPAGLEMIEIAQALRDVEAAHAAERERKARSAALADAALHRRVFRRTAEDHGLGFAKRTIGNAPASIARAIKFAEAAENIRQEMDFVTSVENNLSGKRKAQSAKRKTTPTAPTQVRAAFDPNLL